MANGWTKYARRVRRPFRKLREAAGDLVERWRDPNRMIPPKRLDFVGGTNFVEVGEEFIRYFIELGKLQPHHCVLDVGCGIGRMAIPLTKVLSSDGSYYGFDIVEKGIKWCNERVASRFPNFHFLHSNVYNKSYNPQGVVQPRDYKFPYADNMFDFVFLTSVFTHMLTVDMHHYLDEIARVMKPAGRCVVTFFLLNDESQALVTAGNSTQNFVHPLQGCVTVNQEVPECAIAYNESDITALFAKKNLQIDQPIRYGSWCGRSRFLSYQDIVIASKL